MSYEIDDNQYPNTAVVYITARWGSATYTGTGVLVGDNDVLTAAHVIYSAEFGRVADEIWIYPSYDPDEATHPRFAPTFVQYFPDFDPDADGMLITGDFYRDSYAGSEKDIALLTLGQDISAQYGTFGIDPNFGGGSVGVIGYPGVYGRQPVYDSGTATRSSIDNTLYIGSDLEVNPGNSGGPIFYDYGGGPYVVGLVSTRAAAVFIGGHWDWLQEALLANDNEFGDGVSPTISLSADKLTLAAGDSATLVFRISEPTSDFTIADIAVSAGTLRNFSQISSTLYAVDYVPPENAQLLATVSVASGRFSDTAGNVNLDGGDADNAVTFSIDTVPEVQTFAGTVRADKMIGTANDDIVYGYAGNDKISTGGGADVIYAGLGNDIAAAGDGDDYLQGNAGRDVLDGGNDDDEIDGGAGNDKLNGGNGADVLDGGAGADNLTGGTGADLFVFSADSFAAPTRALKAADRDSVRDFTPGSDTLVFVVFEGNGFGFGGLAAYATGTAMDAAAFTAGDGIKQAADADDRLIYDTRSGLLYYDADGRGGLAAMPVATLIGKPALEASDIYVTEIPA
jgi:Ca2+-binding RTX toxin-like protein